MTPAAQAIGRCDRQQENSSQVTAEPYVLRWKISIC